MFERPHHQRIAVVLEALDAALFVQHRCYFGGGTAIALSRDEFRESVDIDLMVSDTNGYRALRELLTQSGGINHVLRATPSGSSSVTQAREIRADQYGIRTMLEVAGAPIKFEIVLEGRISLDAPSAAEQICGMATLSAIDRIASKLLANSDRWADDANYSRDVIDLAMLAAPRALFRQGIEKAKLAYGNSIETDLTKAINRLQERQGWLDRCMQAMAMTLPRQVLWKRLKSLARM